MRIAARTLVVLALCASPVLAADTAESQLTAFQKKYNVAEWASDHCGSFELTSEDQTYAVLMSTSLWRSSKSPTPQMVGRPAAANYCKGIGISHTLLDWPKDLPPGTYVVAAKRSGDPNQMGYPVQVVGVLNNKAVDETIHRAAADRICSAGFGEQCRYRYESRPK